MVLEKRLALEPAFPEFPLQLSSRLARRAMGSLSAFMNQLKLPRRFRSSATRSGLPVMERASMSATSGLLSCLSRPGKAVSQRLATSAADSFAVAVGST